MNILVSKSSFELSNRTLVLKSFSLAYRLTSDPLTFKIISTSPSFQQNEAGSSDLPVRAHLTRMTSWCSIEPKQRSRSGLKVSSSLVWIECLALGSPCGLSTTCVVGTMWESVVLKSDSRVSVYATHRLSNRQHPLAWNFIVISTSILSMMTQGLSLRRLMLWLGLKLWDCRSIFHI